MKKNSFAGVTYCISPDEVRDGVTALLVKKVEVSPPLKIASKQNTNIQTACSIIGTPCLVIDPGTKENIGSSSSSVVRKTELKHVPHVVPYDFSWMHYCTTIIVNQCCPFFFLVKIIY